MNDPATDSRPDETHIKPVSGWQLVDWKELLAYRDLFYYMVKRDVAVLYKQTILGFTWAIITPVSQMIIFSFIFGKGLKIDSDGIPYPIFSYSALLPWTYFAGALTAASGSLISGAGVYTKVYFPRMLVPTVPIFSKLVDFAIASSVLVLMMFYYKFVPTLNVLMLPVLLVLMILTASGVGMWLAALAVQFRDVRHAMTFVTQLMMFAAPVIWATSAIDEKYRLAYGLYPMAGVIEGFRSAITGKTAMPWDLIGMGALSACLIFVTGAFYYKRTERVFADVA